MGDNFEIGKSKYGNNKAFGEGKNWFYLENNKDNVFRVLPAMFNLARTGQYTKWYAIHRGLRGTNGRQMPFLCIEESDRKTKTITRQCPMCNKHAEFQNKHDLIKAQGGATAEQLREFEMGQIWPLNAEYKYYLNVVNQEGKIGLLAIGSKMYKSLDALATDWEGKGYDITGTTGLFLNFRIASSFKGDKQAVHAATVFLSPSLDGSFRPLTHEITPDFVNKLKFEASDLSTLFKEIPAEAMALLAETSGADRALLVDKIFAVPEKDEAKAAPLNTHIPGTDATMVGRAEIHHGQINIAMPAQPVQTPNAAPQVAQGNPFPGVMNMNTFNTPVTVAPVVSQPAPAAANPFAQPAQAAPVATNPFAFGAPTVQPQSAPVVQKTVQNLSDAEFYGILGVKK